MANKNKFEEGSYLKIEGVVVKGTKIRKTSHVGNCDALFPPKGYIKLLFTKIQNFVVTTRYVFTHYGITVIRDKNGEHWFIIGALKKE